MMGQSSSSNSSSENIIPETVTVIQDEVLRQARIFSEIAALSYEDFQLCLEQLNKLSRKVIDQNGKQLMFAVKKGTDSTVLWKGTVKIACVKIDPETKEIECHRLFNLNQFMRIFKTLKCQLTAALQSSQKEMLESSGLDETTHSDNFCKFSKPSDSDSVNSEDSSYHESISDNSSSLSSDNESEEKKEELAGSSNCDKRPGNTKLNSCAMRKFTASMLLEEVDNLANSYTNSMDKLGECCICLERKPDMMLPCAHAYCMLCIEQWNTWHKTCPICRETLDNTDDTWVISDIPGSQEISEEICSALMNLTSAVPWVVPKYTNSTSSSSSSSIPALSVKVAERSSYCNSLQIPHYVFNILKPILSNIIL